LAAKVLSVAADKVASEPVTRPPDDQWIYSKFIQTQTGQATQSDENWIQFDGRQSAYFQDGQLVVHDEGVTPTPTDAGGLAAYDDSATPLTAYNALASLPSNPATILAMVGAIVGTTPRDWENWASGSAVSELAPTSQGQAEFDYLAQLLWNACAAAPPAAQASVYRAMADIPGVTVRTGLTNAVGRTAIGVSANGGLSWLLLADLPGDRHQREGHQHRVPEDQELPAHVLRHDLHGLGGRRPGRRPRRPLTLGNGRP